MSRKSIEAEQEITAKEVAVSYAEENLQGFSEYEARRKYEMDQIIARKMVKRIFATVLA